MSIQTSISRKVSVNRARTLQEALNATGVKQCTNPDVVSAISKGERENAEAFFFKTGCFVTDDELENEYELRNLKPADVYLLSAVNEDDPAFVDRHPNGTHWKDSNGRWCFATFDRGLGGREVDVGYNNRGWDDDWWFVGVRKL